jgi:hypothetical protein
MAEFENVAWDTPATPREPEMTRDELVNITV